MPIAEELKQELMRRNIIAFRIGQVFMDKKSSLFKVDSIQIFKYIELISSDGQITFVYDNQTGYETFLKEAQKCFYDYYRQFEGISSQNQKKFYFFRYLINKQYTGAYNIFLEKEDYEFCGIKHYLFAPLEEVIKWVSIKCPQFEDATIDLGESRKSNVDYVVKKETLKTIYGKKYIYGFKEYFKIDDVETVKSIDATLERYSEIISAITQGEVASIIGNAVNVLYEYYLNEKNKLETGKIEFLAERQSEIGHKNDNAQNNDWGNQGEKEVEYALRWLPSEYISIKRDCISKYNKEAILLKNSAISDESQEFDHIVVGTQGIFLIETKYYKGKIIIDTYGNWIREDENGKQKGEKNPIQQIDRHHYLLKSIVDTDEIQDIICIAHDEAIIDGQENSLVPIVKADMLVRYITEHQTGRKFNAEEKEKIIKKIEQYKVRTTIQKTDND